MKRIAVLSVLLLIGALAGVPPASAGVPIITTVAAGGTVVISAPGVVRADITPANVATASSGADQVTVTGLQPGVATLVVTTSQGIEARPIQVVAAASPGLALDDPVGCAGAWNAIGGDPSHVVFDHAGWHIALSPGTWDVAWQLARARLDASSAVGSPLEALGIPAALGFQAQWGDHWDLTATQAIGMLDYHIPFPIGAGTLTFGGSTRGLIGEATVAPVSGVTFSGVALMPSFGQGVVGAARTGVDMGPVTLAYTTGPAGGSPELDFHTGPVMVSATAPPGQGATVGLSLGLGGIGSIQGSWTPQVGWNAQVALSLGPSGTAQPAGSMRNAQAYSGTPASCAAGPTGPTG
jgi:hypothetical protein